MKKVIFVFGAIAGIVVSVLGFMFMALFKNGVLNFDNGDYFGYASIVLSLSMVFFGVKSFRDNYQKGVIKFGKALMVGLAISLVASFVWAVVSEIHYQVATELNNEIMDRYCEFQITKIEQSGASNVEMEAKIKEVNDMRSLYDNPAARFAMTVATILPIGIIVSLISAAILRKREILPA